ncbi:signal peptidase I [Naasia sp. SYSU D00948]|uniref:signal peptidase I n=1 Tax=Naasia sp. SYSU D00948 TaxID=2817379 RepID=UPI001FED9E41|nr:signal peptidase I [Naasia sp. SYSU D00948]
MRTARSRALRAGRLAVGGAAGVVVVLCAALLTASALGVQVVRLTSGSMSPDLPAGALVLVADVAASDVLPGEVVLAQRPGAAPVLHRVIGVATSGSRTELVLQGDANRAADPLPYTAARVGRLVLGVPWGGQVVQALASPAGILGSSAVVSALTYLALAPSRRREAAA